MLLSTGRKRMMSAVALASGLALLVSGCSSDPKPADKPGANAEAQTLRIWAGSETPITKNYNPYAPGVLHGALGPVYETLFAYNKAAAGDPTPMLGESYEFSEDGTSITIKVRQGVKWNDGTDFTAEDVAYSFINETAKSSYIKDAEVVDASTVKLTFDGPQFTSEFSILGATYIVPKAVWEGVENPVEWDNPTPVGTGPYVVEATTDASYSLKANPTYWQKGKPAVKNLQYIGVDKNNSAENLLKADKLDWAGMFVAEPDALTADGRLGTINTPMDPTVLYTCANVDLGCKGAQTDVAVRQAINVAIDRSVIIDKAFANQAGKISPTFALPGRDDEWVAEGMPSEAPQTANVEEAGKILEAAGYAKGDDGIYAKGKDRVSMKLISVATWSDYNNAADLIAQQARAAGIEIIASETDWAGFSDGRQTGQFELIIGGVIGTSIADPFQIYRDWFSGDFTQKVGTQLESGQWNFSRYSNPKVDAAVKTAAGTQDETVKKEAYAAIQKEIVNDLPYIPLVINGTQVFYNKKSFDGWPTEEDLFAFPPSWGAVSAGQVLINLTGK